MFFREIFRREDIVRRMIFNEESTTLDYFFLFDYG
jgi:hypothetical protein